MSRNGRQPLPVGAHGNITARKLQPGVYRAKCWVRDLDGEMRQATKRGRSREASINNLKQALLERRHDGGGEINRETKLAVIGERWFENLRKLVEAGDKAPRTLATYESAWRLHVGKGLGKLRAREVTPGRCEDWLIALRERVGPSMCATSRTVLSGVCGLAVRMGAMDVNPVRELSPIPGAKSRARKPRAMTAEERTRWLDWMDDNVADEPRKPDAPPRAFVKRRNPAQTRAIAKSRALGDITRFALGTGCRIGEAMAVSWDEVDLDSGTVLICWHIVRVKGKGLVRMPGAKSEAGDRLLQLPSWCRDMLVRRRIEQESAYPIFPDALGGWRDPNLVMRWIRWSRDEAGFSWVTSHVWRQTVITVLDDAGLKPREVADQAGHARISQTQAYMQRKIASEAAAAALEDLL